MSTSRYSLHRLRDILREIGLLDRGTPITKRLAQAIKLSEVREILDLQLPKISDLTGNFPIQKDGRLLAVRMDLLKNVDNHKKHVVACLILRGVLSGLIPKKGVDTLIDGGNFNSAIAVRYYANRFGMKAMYIMSYLFPRRVLDILVTDNFSVILAPHRYENAKEREFYEYLVEQMKKSKFRRNKFCLWHARHGGEVMYPIGREIAQELKEKPDCVVSCVGAGSTLTGLQLAVQDHFHGDIRVIVAEHELSPLFVKHIPPMDLPGLPFQDMAEPSDIYWCVDGVPHFVIGPHWDEINQMLPEESMAKIDVLVQYSERDWQTTHAHLELQGVSVGNSSAANLSVAVRLANGGQTVLTVVFEPSRAFYKKPELIS